MPLIDTRVLVRWAMLLQLSCVPASVPSMGHHAVQASPDGPMRGPPGTVVDPVALEHILERAKESNTDALVILRNGELVGEWHFGSRDDVIETMSITKSIVSLAVGRLLDDGSIRSLDEPVYTWFPQWKDAAHRSITLRMLLTHTSCLPSGRRTNAIYASHDWVQLAVESSPICEPGTRAWYNNEAVNLLAPIVAMASGVRLDEYVRKYIFSPLGITDYVWATDPVGHPQCMAGLAVRAMDLAKIGQMMVDGGVWRGRRIVSDSWIAASTGRQRVPPVLSSAPWGMLWWWIPSSTRMGYDDTVLATMRDAGLPAAVLGKLTQIKDHFYTANEFTATLRAILSADDMQAILAANDYVVQKLGDSPAFELGPSVGFDANGSLGQFLIVIPAQHLVVVRLRREPRVRYDESTMDTFKELPELALRLVDSEASGSVIR